MSELAQLTGATTSDDVLPGHVLSKWSISEIGAAEQEFQQDHIRTVSIGASAASPDVQSQMVQTAQDSVAWGYFLYGAPGFWVKTSATYLLPFILWLSLRAKQPQVTRAAAETLITEENRLAVALACRKCAGWKQSPNSPRAAEQPTVAPPSAPTPSPGDVSTKSSPDAV